VQHLDGVAIAGHDDRALGVAANRHRAGGGRQRNQARLHRSPHHLKIGRGIGSVVQSLQGLVQVGRDHRRSARLRLVLVDGHDTTARAELCTCGRGRPRSRHAQDCAYAGETPAHPGTLRIARMRARRPRTQGRSGLRVCGRDARAPGTRRIARMRAGRPRTQGARGSPLLQGWYGIGARRVPGCPIAVRPVHATFRDGKQKPRTRSPQLPGAVWRARPAQ
jgi:hypothetical protein